MSATSATATGADEQARQAREIELLRGLVAIPSLSGEERAAVDYLCAAMAELGFATSVDEAGNAVGTVGNGPREIVLLGHIDTVPGHIPVRIEDGVLHGRGSVDAKGPLATFVCAVARVAAAELGDWKLTIIGAVGEEADSVGAYHIVDRYRPEFALIGEPSGWDAVVLGYRGSMYGTYELRQPGMHSGAPVPTAPQIAIDFWNRVTRHTELFNEGRSGDFDRLEAKLRAISSGSDGLHDTVSLRMGFRLPPGIDGETLTAQLREIAHAEQDADAEIAIETFEPLSAFRSDKNSPLVRAFLPAIRAEGSKPRLKVKTGTADMNIVGPVWNCPIVAYGPGDSKLDHTPQERQVLDDYVRASRVLAAALRAVVDSR